MQIIEAHSPKITTSNEVLVAQIAQNFNLSFDDIEKGITQFKPSANRQEIFSFYNTH